MKYKNAEINTSKALRSRGEQKVWNSKRYLFRSSVTPRRRIQPTLTRNEFLQLQGIIIGKYNNLRENK
jgi:hypothetical protein